ncbi:MAG: primosomal protein N', partial [bacterium]
YEITERMKMDFPPFTRLVLIVLSHNSREKVISAALNLKEALCNYKIDILGPAPAPIERIRGQYRYQILLRYKELENIIRTLEKVKFPSGVKIKVVVDPLEMM